MVYVIIYQNLPTLTIHVQYIVLTVESPPHYRMTAIIIVGIMQLLPVATIAVVCRHLSVIDLKKKPHKFVNRHLHCFTIKNLIYMTDPSL